MYWALHACYTLNFLCEFSLKTQYQRFTTRGRHCWTEGGDRVELKINKYEITDLMKLDPFFSPNRTGFTANTSLTGLHWYCFDQVLHCLLNVCIIQLKRDPNTLTVEFFFNDRNGCAWTSTKCQMFEIHLDLNRITEFRWSTHSD